MIIAQSELLANKMLGPRTEKTSVPILAAPARRTAYKHILNAGNVEQSHVFSGLQFPAAFVGSFLLARFSALAVREKRIDHATRTSRFDGISAERSAIRPNKGATAYAAAARALLVVFGDVAVHRLPRAAVAARTLTRNNRRIKVRNVRS